MVQELVDSAWSVCAMAEEGSVHSQVGSYEKSAYEQITACVWVFVCYIYKESFEWGTE